MTEKRGPDDGAIALNRILAQAERQVTRRLDPVLAEERLTVDQWRVLDLLSDGEGHTMSEIGAAIVVPGPSLTKILDRLVDAAAVYRLVDDRDRRRVLAFVSDLGQEVHGRLAPRLAAIEADVLATLTGAGDELLRLLVRLTSPQPAHSDAATRGPLIPPG